MKKPDKNTILLLLLYLIVTSYLLMKTGLVSDDFELMSFIKGHNFSDFFSFRNFFYFAELPGQHLTHYWWYYFFQPDGWLIISLAKTLYILLSLYLISRFFLLFTDRQNALLVSFIFLFFPSHDASTYWFMVQYLTLSFAFYLYAFYLAHKKRLALAFSLALAGSFVSYGSTPLAVSLFLLFAMRRRFKEGIVLLVPNIIYVAYYLSLTKVYGIGLDKTSMSDGFSIYLFLKRFILQIVTFADATVGPSMWLKIYYAFSQLSALSITLGAALVVIFYKKYKERPAPYDPKLVLSLAVLAVLSFGTLAVTGHYPQLCFNLGNRVTIFGSLLLAYLIVLLPGRRIFKTAVFALAIFTILGISDHWKNWNIHQQKVIANIRNNETLKSHESTAEMIYVSGNQYSKYGPLSHIEFLSEGWVVFPIFNLSFENCMPVHPINKNYVLKGDYLVDKRCDEKTKIGNHINVYDSEKNTFFRISRDSINDYLGSLPPENRHWIQFTRFSRIKDAIFMLMPRLKCVL